MHIINEDGSYIVWEDIKPADVSDDAGVGGSGHVQVVVTDGVAAITVRLRLHLFVDRDNSAGVKQGAEVLSNALAGLSKKVEAVHAVASDPKSFSPSSAPREITIPGVGTYTRTTSKNAALIYELKDAVPEVTPGASVPSTLLFHEGKWSTPGNETAYSSYVFAVFAYVANARSRANDGLRELDTLQRQLSRQLALSGEQTEDDVTITHAMA